MHGLAALVAFTALFAAATPTARAAEEGVLILVRDALLTNQVGGLDRTKATAQVVAVDGQAFPKALRVTVGTASAETNATQLTMQNAAPVKRGDALIATFWVRGASADGKRPGQIEFLFERCTDPWTKSIWHDAIAPRPTGKWKRFVLAFLAAEDYRPGEAMASVRFAFGPQTVEVGGLEVRDMGPGLKPDDIAEVAARENPLGRATVTLRLADTRQTMVGLGGDFCQPRYGSSEAMDAVGQYNLDHLRVAHARIGIPLNSWAPERGVYKDEGPAHASFLAMQEMAKRKIPFAGSIWEGPQWMLGGRREQSGRELPPDRVADCIEAIAQYLVTARDKYQVTLDNLSFNEPDYGVNFKFTAPQMAAFIAKAGPRFRQLGLKTRFLIGDTGGGVPSAEYCETLLKDAAIASYLGPISFHCWDALGAPDAAYEAIAQVGRKYHKSIWCLEAGHDAGLWERPDPWESWENALRTALAYERTLRLTGAEVMDYWTYQDNYPIVSKDGTRPFRVHHVIRQMADVFTAGAKVATATVSGDDLCALPTVGPKPGQFALLLVNPVGAGSVRLTGLPAGASVRVVTSTRAAQNEVAKPARADAKGALTVALPARSVVSVLSEAR